MDGSFAAVPAASGVRPLEVVHVLHTVAYGGVETIVLDWARAMDGAPGTGRRARIHLVCFANPGGTEQAFLHAAARAGLAVRTIPWARRKPVWQAARALRSILREVDADVVHTHNLYAELVGWIAARRHGAKLATSLYVWSDFGWKRNAQQWVAARLLRRFDLVTSQCRMTMDETVRRGVPVRLQRLLVSGIAAGPLDPRADRAERRAAMGCSAEEVVLINVARFYPEKGQERLLDWFAAIHAARPVARLWLLGVGPLEEALKAKTAALGLESAVRFLGFAPSTAPMFAAADIQVHSSTAEGIPLAICEGMACGMPIVSTAVGGIPEVVTDGGTGFLVGVDAADRFIARTIELIDDPALRARFGAGARHASETELSLDRAADRLDAMYRELAA